MPPPGICANCGNFFNLHDDGLCPYCHYAVKENVPEVLGTDQRDQAHIADQAATAPVAFPPLGPQTGATPGQTPPMPEDRGTIEGPSVFETGATTGFDVTHGNPVPTADHSAVAADAQETSRAQAQAAQEAAPEVLIPSATVDPGADAEAAQAGRPREDQHVDEHQEASALAQERQATAAEREGVANPDASQAPDNAVAATNQAR